MFNSFYCRKFTTEQIKQQMKTKMDNFREAYKDEPATKELIEVFNTFKEIERKFGI